jgi:hypothetical protein
MKTFEVDTIVPSPYFLRAVIQVVSRNLPVGKVLAGRCRSRGNHE